MTPVAFYILTDHDETRVLHRFEAPTRLDEVNWPGTLTATPQYDEPDPYRVGPISIERPTRLWWDAHIEGRFKNYTRQVVANTFTVEGQDPWRELDDFEVVLTKRSPASKTALALIQEYKRTHR